MRIDPNLVVSPTTLDTRKAHTDAKGSAPAPDGASTVTLSSAGAAMAASPSPSPGITARLEKIRALIDQGEFPVDLDKLASRIVDDDILRSGGAK